jgi:hypothetical protein
MNVTAVMFLIYRSLVVWAMRVVMFRIIRLALLGMTNQRPGAVPGPKTAGKSDF